MPENDTAHVSEHQTEDDVVVAARGGPGGATVVCLHGEIDLLSVPALSERLDALTARPRPDLVLDLRPVTFIDCVGLGILCRARNRILARQGRLRLVADSAGFRRLLRTTGLLDVFEVCARPPRPLPVRHGPSWA
ncbi:STAS domain-containing protein [Streptomyces naphthomycinicus]|uniref:STAS domain-containing protein n=1 Tax=Streptomyces naphthomycinicus TaxID=2872625 RepID=UPI001CEC91D3|nr:STAS domain-containing protein [Streptomyces sp. TML10]